MNSQQPLLSIQAPSAVVMIRPHHFTVNTETAADNAFQDNVSANSSDAKLAYDEITNAANILITHGVRVHMFEDEGKQTPDSVFPNNWFSTHSGGHVAIYPMKPENRRLERRYDIIEMLKKDYRVQDMTDYSGLEQDDLFLEGTGAMVLDHMARVAYAVESDRTNPIILERFCTHFNFEPMVFKASDEEGTAIYHTNVLMCIGTDYALIGLDMIENQARRDEIATRLENSGKRVIALTNDQIRNFAGNAIELQGQDGRLLALSQTAFEALSKKQISMLETSVKLVPLEIPTIEKAGGSVRCTLAGIHLASRD
ncbi:citrulline utilization hydrolase CtlX [Curvivirga sp.]|uniref:citrulline utilization hydrolase CtlX n=1 Tax=Curvivirga sp. TaxID=2856848 RepID=UPI003B5A0D90